MENKGFTLLEVLVVVGIMGLMAAMIWPMRGTLDDSQRERVTIEKMDAIVEAILGHEQIKDHYDLSRTIGGYVGDMGKWPKLYEPGGTGGLDGKRGEFVGGRFQWERPFKNLIIDGDTKKESLGQPRGLWTKDELEADDDRKKWKGPYLTPPVTRNPALGKHYAKNQAEYEGLDPTDREYFHLLQGSEQLTDGWNRAFRFFITDGGETFCLVSLGRRGFGYEDDYEQDCDPDSPENQGKIVRALRKSDLEAVRAQSSRRSTVVTKLIFLTEDRIEQDIVRSLIGESPSGTNTGYTGDLLDWPELFNWVCKLESVIYPCGTVCRVSSGPNSGDWRVISESRDDEGDIVSGSYQNDAGAVITCSGGTCINADSEVGAFDCVLPEGRWEKEYQGQPFTVGQPRGLWDKQALDSILQESEFGVGWRHAYLPKPNLGAFPTASDIVEDEYVLDAFEVMLHIFKIEDQGGTQLLIASGGPSESIFMPIALKDGESEDDRRHFLHPAPPTGEMTIAEEITKTRNLLEHRTGTFKLAEFGEQAEKTHKIEDAEGNVIATYDNRDNITRLVRRNEWLPGFMDVTVVVQDALETDELVCWILGVVDQDGTPLESPSTIIESNWESEKGRELRIKYDDGGENILVTGGRYLDCRLKEGSEPEKAWEKILSIYGHPSRIADRDFTLRKANFTPLPEE
ncbi:prepilin-type N-terminal cleavage/methylation domain-containing protein [Desulfonatronum zhilinae]|nr:prepilin-type N-terminal cleavage/methylation domain-containing protein [Desulfonatronum zhilinae]